MAPQTCSKSSVLFNTLSEHKGDIIISVLNAISAIARKDLNFSGLNGIWTLTCDNYYSAVPVELSSQLLACSAGGFWWGEWIYISIGCSGRHLDIVESWGEVKKLPSVGERKKNWEGTPSTFCHSRPNSPSLQWIQNSGKPLDRPPKRPALQASQLHLQNISKDHQFNRPFPSSFQPLFQGEYVKVFVRDISPHSNWNLNKLQKFLHLDVLQNDTEGNSEMG